MDRDTIYQNFTYHPPTEDSKILHVEVRERAMQLALWLESHLPPSRERSLAITNLEQTVFWANAGIARYQVDDEAMV